MSSSLSSVSRTPVPPEPSWKPILECAVAEVFELMASTHLDPVTPAEGVVPHGDITSMVGMAGALCGMTTIRCSRAAAEKFASKMLGADVASDPAAVGDALGELCNMVAGNFKSKISSLADHCMLSVPTVISGEDYNLQPANPSEMIQVALQHADEIIWVSLIVHT